MVRTYIIIIKPNVRDAVIVRVGNGGLSCRENKKKTCVASSADAFRWRVRGTGEEGKVTKKTKMMSAIRFSRVLQILTF